MGIDPVVAVIVVLALAVALGFGGMLLSDRANKRDMKRVEDSRREERANQERREQERLERLEEAHREESQAMEAARRQMAFAQEELHGAQQAFKAQHDQLVGSIHLLAKAGCDAQFQQYSGISRLPKAEKPEEDAEVQDYLREHYAELRDSVLEDAIGAFMAAEVERRLKALEADADADAETPEAAGDGALADAPEAAAEEEAPAEAPGETGEGEALADAPGEADDEALGEAPEEAPATGATDHGPDAVPPRDAIEAAVREEFDIDSIRTYLLAAISARYDADGRPLGELPWPAYTRISPRGYGELALPIGAPTYVQNSYREFAWKKFHMGRRPEKPTRGEYSWPASHTLGDNIPVDEVPTPAGAFFAEGPSGRLPLFELLDCAWIRHSMDYQGALLAPDGQRSFFINIEGLHKDDVVTLRFDGPDFLEEAEDGPFFLNATGEVNGAFVGISASKPEAASLGEAPYELAERTPNGFAFRLTHDARRYDADTYPQFMEVHLAWCQPPSPRPERIVRHVCH